MKRALKLRAPFGFPDHFCNYILKGSTYVGGTKLRRVRLNRSQDDQEPIATTFIPEGLARDPRQQGEGRGMGVESPFLSELDSDSSRLRLKIISQNWQRKAGHTR